MHIMCILWMWFSVDNLEAFVEHLLIGKLDVYVKSAPQPQADDGLIKVNSIFSVVMPSAAYCHFIKLYTLYTPFPKLKRFTI